ncbi:MAG: hypothetical protein LBV69_03335 [Bacteroidales bacterium]|nr:hypothetical protein [Bacteroidales bacterium]
MPPEEIDFVCTKNGETLYVQVTIELSLPETIDREFGNLLKINDNYPKMVISGERSLKIPTKELNTFIFAIFYQKYSHNRCICKKHAHFGINIVYLHLKKSINEQIR